MMTTIVNAETSSVENASEVAAAEKEKGGPRETGKFFWVIA